MATLTIRRDGRWSVLVDGQRERRGQLSRRHLAWFLRNLKGQPDSQTDDMGRPRPRQVTCADVDERGPAGPLVIRPDPRGPCWTGEAWGLLTEPLGGQRPLSDTELPPERDFGDGGLEERFGR